MSSRTLPAQQRFGQTSRQDAWWLQSLIVFLGFTAFIVYSTWAAFAGRDYSFGSYLSQCNTYEAQLLDERMWDGRYDRSVIATLRISVERVDAAAQELMRACVFLHADGIPMDLLMGGVVQQSDKFTTSPGRGGSMTMVVDRAMGMLMRFSLVHRDQGSVLVIDDSHQSIDFHLGTIELVVLDRDLGPREHRLCPGDGKRG